MAARTWLAGGLGLVGGEVGRGVEGLFFIPTSPHLQMWHRLQNALDKMVDSFNPKSKYGRWIGGGCALPHS